MQSSLPPIAIERDFVTQGITISVVFVADVADTLCYQFISLLNDIVDCHAGLEFTACLIAILIVCDYGSSKVGGGGVCENHDLQTTLRQDSQAGVWGRECDRFTISSRGWGTS